MLKHLYLRKRIIRRSIVCAATHLAEPSSKVGHKDCQRVTYASIHPLEEKGRARMLRFPGVLRHTQEDLKSAGRGLGEMMSPLAVLVATRSSAAAAMAECSSTSRPTTWARSWTSRHTSTPGCTTSTAQGATHSDEIGIHVDTGRPEDMGRFRVPSLRGVTASGPWTHGLRACLRPSRRWSGWALDLSSRPPAASAF